ncbi:hypothetical protein [Nonomuraea rosea]
MLRLTAAPARLDRVATTLAEHAELAFVAATTNLMANALCTDPAAVHRYPTHGLDSAERIHTIETAPALRTVKATGPLTIADGHQTSSTPAGTAVGRHPAGKSASRSRSPRPAYLPRRTPAAIYPPGSMRESLRLDDDTARHRPPCFQAPHHTTVERPGSCRP